MPFFVPIDYSLICTSLVDELAEQNANLCTGNQVFSPSPKLRAMVTVCTCQLLVLTRYEHGGKSSFSYLLFLWRFPMRTHWRIFPFLGLFLVGMICLAAVPYFHHLVYPDSLPRSAVRRAIGYAAISEDRQAVIPLDRQIDELGVPDHIRTEADARAYVEALVKRWWGNETNPSLAEFEERLTQAEYAAVRDPKKLIPESQVAKTFNRLMDEWGMPLWTRISVPELHAFKISYTLTVYPRSVARLPDESIAPSCRPTEALLLLHLLDSNGGVPLQIRERVRETRFPWNLLKRLRWSRPTLEPPVEYGLHPEPLTPESRQRGEYIICQRRYFASHPEITFDREVSEIFSELGIH